MSNTRPALILTAVNGRRLAAGSEDSPTLYSCTASPLLSVP